MLRLMSREQSDRHVNMISAARMSMGSDHESDSSSSTDSDNDEKNEDNVKRKIARSKAKNLERLAKKYKNYKGFVMADVLKGMSDSGQRIDKKKQVLVDMDRSHTLLSSRRTTPDHTSSDSALPLIQPKSHLHPNHLSKLKGRKPHAHAEPNDSCLSDGEESAESSVLSRSGVHSRGMSRKERDDSRKSREDILLKKKRAEYVKRFGAITDPKRIPKKDKYGATSRKYSEITSVLRKISKALENISRHERRELVERGQVELVGRTTLRFRLQTYLDVKVTSKEINLLFNKFDPNEVGTVNIADIYGNALGVSAKKKKTRLSNSRSTSGRSDQKSGNEPSRTISRGCESWNWYTEEKNEQSPDIVINTVLEEKLNAMGGLDGNISCSVELRKPHERVEDADEVEEDESLNKLSKTAPCPPKNRHMDFNKTIATDIHDFDFDKFDEFADSLTPDYGMGCTQNVREFNTLAESDSVNNVILCRIEEDEEEEEQESLDGNCATTTLRTSCSIRNSRDDEVDTEFSQD